MSIKKPAPPPPDTADTAVSGKGMPQKTPLAQRSRPGSHATPADVSVESSLSLPHERDQSLDMTGGTPSPESEQAFRDVKRGIKDTSKATEMDQAYRGLDKR
ncbi:MAG: hypothetical protein ABIR35_06915 [Polaromonas sp.]